MSLRNVYEELICNLKVVEVSEWKIMSSKDPFEICVID